MSETDSHVYINTTEDRQYTGLQLSDINREDSPYDTIHESNNITSNGIETNGNISPERGPNNITDPGRELNGNISAERGPNNAKCLQKKYKYVIFVVIFVLVVGVVGVGIYLGIGQQSEDKTPADGAIESPSNTSFTTTVALTENDTPVYTEEYLEEKIQNLATRFAQYSDKIEDLESRLQKVEEGRNARYQAPFIAVAPKESNYSSLQRLLFNHTEVNPGGYYDLTTGLYRCPANGIYFFRLMMSTEHRASGIIGQSGATRLEISFSRPDGVSLATFTGSIITYCRAGAVVFSATSHQSFLVDSSQMNTFSGFLIEELS